MQRSVRVLLAVVMAVAVGVVTPASAANSCTAKTKNQGPLSLPGVCQLSTPKCAAPVCFLEFRIDVVATFAASQGGSVRADLTFVSLPVRFVGLPIPCAAANAGGSGSCHFQSCCNQIPSGMQHKALCLIRPMPPQTKVIASSATCTLHQF